MDHRIKNTKDAATTRTASPGVRSDAQRVARIIRIRRELEGGSYESAAKLSIAADRLLLALGLTGLSDLRPTLCVRSRQRCRTSSL